MAHFAKLGVGNKVQEVIVINNDVFNTEQEGIDFINNLYGTNDTWKKTSYNTRGGVHYGQDGNPDDGIPFRKNFAGVGSKYDQARDAFIPPKPYESWILDEDSCQWEPPVDYPADWDSVDYEWNEENQTWDLAE